jgi:hypothetical protein
MPDTSHLGSEAHFERRAQVDLLFKELNLSNRRRFEVTEKALSAVCRGLFEKAMKPCDVSHEFFYLLVWHQLYLDIGMDVNPVLSNADSF